MSDSPSSPSVDSAATKRLVRAVFFDMDGTLLESSEIWFKLLHGACAHFGFPELQYDDWKSTFGQSMAMNVIRFMPGTDQNLVDAYCVENFGKHLHHVSIIDGAVEALEFAAAATGDRTYIVTNCPMPITTQILSAPQAARVRELLRSPDGTLRIVAADDLVPAHTIAADPAANAAIDAALAAEKAVAANAAAVKAAAVKAAVATEDAKTATETETKAEAAVLAKLPPKPHPGVVFEASRRVGVPAHECLLVGDSVYDVGCTLAAGAVAVGIVAKGGHAVVENVSDIARLDHLVTYSAL